MMFKIYFCIKCGRSFGRGKPITKDHERQGSTYVSASCNGKIGMTRVEVEPEN